MKELRDPPPAAAPDAGAPQENAGRISELVKVLRERTWLSPVSAEEMNHRDRWLADQIERLMTDQPARRAEVIGGEPMRCGYCGELGRVFYSYDPAVTPDICQACFDAAHAEPAAPAAHQERTEPHELAEIRAFYDEHAPLDSHEHKTLIQRVRDEWHDFMAVVDHCSKVYDHFSRGRISKPMTLPREVIALAEDFASEDTEEAIKEAREEGEADVAAPAAHQERTLEPSKGCIDSTPFLRARMHWYRDGCPDLEDVAQYFVSGECVRDAANDLELALTDIETLRAQRDVAEEKGARMHAAVTATEDGHSVLAHKYNDRAACPACNDAPQLAPAAHQERTEPPTTGRFRKKPVVIDAIQFTGNNRAAVVAFLGGEEGEHRIPKDGRPRDAFLYAVINTLEGSMIAKPDDWIIRGVKGEFYPCKPDIFAATYEPEGAPARAAEWHPLTTDEYQRVLRLADDGARAFHARPGMIPFEDCQHPDCRALRKGLTVAPRCPRG